MKKNLMSLLYAALFCITPYVTASTFAASPPGFALAVRNEPPGLPPVIRLLPHEPGESTMLGTHSGTSVDGPCSSITFDKRDGFACYLRDEESTDGLILGDLIHAQEVDVVFHRLPPKGNQFDESGNYRRRFYLTSPGEFGVFEDALTREDMPYDPFMSTDAVVILIKGVRAALVSPALRNPLGIIPQQWMWNPIPHTSSFQFRTGIAMSYLSPYFGSPEVSISPMNQVRHVRSIHLSATGDGGLEFSRGEGVRIYGNLEVQGFDGDAYGNPPPRTLGETFQMSGHGVVKIYKDRPLIIDELEDIKFVWRGPLEFKLQPWGETTVTAQRAEDPVALLYFLANVYRAE
jgi:hypothetical protein